MPTLTEKTIQNVGLVAALQLSAAVISTLTLVVLARLLTPYDFGVVAVAGIALSFIGQLSDFGLSSAVVQRPDPSGRAVDVAATIRLLLSVVLILSTFVIAAPVADLIAVPAAANVIRVSSLLWLLAGAGFASNALLWKELRFRALAVIGVVTSVAGAFISIVLALGGFSYWSIVLGNIGSAAVTLCALWAVRPWRLRFAFDRTLARQFLSFGKHVFVLGILVFAFQNVDNIAVAKMLGVSALGFYYLAYKWATVVSGFVTRTVGRVLFPTYSSIQDQPARLRRGFQSSFRAISLASFPAQIGILLVAPEFVTLVLGANWVPAIRPLQILTFLGLMTVLLQPFGDLFLATGRAAYLSRTNILNVALIVPTWSSTAAWLIRLNGCCPVTIS